MCQRPFLLSVGRGSEPGECPICGGPPGRYGRAAPAATTRLHQRRPGTPPKRSADVDIVGHVERATITFTRPAEPGRGAVQVADLLASPACSHYREDGEILVYNRGEKQPRLRHLHRLWLCRERTEAQTWRPSQGVLGLPTSFLDHSAPDRARSSFQVHSAGRAEQVIRRQTLAARETTDVLLLDVSACMPPVVNEEEAVALSSRLWPAPSSRPERGS